MPQPDIRDITSDKAKELRDRAYMQSVQSVIRSAGDEFKDDVEFRMERFRRIIRDGVADEIQSVLSEAKREIDQHRKLRRLSKQCAEIALEFDTLANSFQQKKALLEKMERVIETIRIEEINTGKNPECSAKINKAVQNADNLKSDILKTTERLLDLREKTERQVHKDRQSEQKVLHTFQHCLSHLSQLDRGKLDVTTRQKLEELNIEDRIKFLSQLIDQLSQNVPAIRSHEIERLLEETKSLIIKKNYSDALQNLDQLFKFDKKNLLGHRLRAEIFQKMNNSFAYLCELRMICEIDDAEGNDFYVLAEVQINNGKLEDAFALLENAVKREPFPKFLERLGDISCQLGHWYRAVQVYQQILRKNRAQIRVKHKLGNALFEDHREEEAFTILREAISQRDDYANSRVSVGRKFRQLRASFIAEQSFSRAVELDANNINALYWRGMLAYDRGEFEKALQNAIKVDQMDPERPRNKVLLAKCYAALGRYNDAVTSLHHTVSRITPPPPVDTLLCYSEICRMAGMAEKALLIIEPFHKRFPYQPQIRAEYGLLLVMAGKLKEAAQYLGPSAMPPPKA